MKTKKNLTTLFVLLLATVLGVQMARAQSAPITPQDQGQDLVSTFENADLSSEQLAVFELRSRQLIQEFVDYYTLLQTTTNDVDMELVLRAEVEQLLYHGYHSLHVNGLDRPYHLSEIPFATTPPISILDIEPIGQEQIALQLFWRYRLSMQVGDERQIAYVSTVLFRQKKAFGTTTKEVWKVALVEWRAR